VLAPSTAPSHGTPATSPPAGPTRRPATAAPTPPAGTGLVEAAHRVEGLIEAGLADGQIRGDVGVDLRNLLRNATAAIGDGALTAAVDRLRGKIADRQGEGSISPGYARQLDAAAAELATGRT
jgi:serine/threonine-protein kinase